MFHWPDHCSLVMKLWTNVPAKVFESWGVQELHEVLLSCSQYNTGNTKNCPSLIPNGFVAQKNCLENVCYHRPQRNKCWKVQRVNKQLKVSCFTHLLATNLAFNSCSLFSAPHTVLAAANRIFSFLRKQLFYFTLHDYLFQGVNQNLGLICFTYYSQ